MGAIFKKYIFLVPIVVSFFCGCKDNVKEEKGVLIEGIVKNAKKGQFVYLEELTPKQRVKIDSTVINGEQFSLRTFIKETGFYVLSLNPKDFVTLLIDTSDTRIYVELDASKELYSSYKVSGSKGSELIMELNHKLHESYKIVDSLQNIFVESRGSENFPQIKKTLDSLYFELLLKHRKYLENFIHKNLGSLVTIIAIYQQLGRNSLFDPEDDLKIFLKVDSALQRTYPNSKHTIYLHEKVLDYKRRKAEKELLAQQLSPGGKFPDINLTTPEGKLFSLSSLKGSPVIVFFWASWNKPSKYELPEISKLYKKYKNKGLEIYAVSLDKDINSWKEIIKKEKLNWINVSDLGYLNSIVVKTHNVTSLPVIYLLDDEGKVIKKGTKTKDIVYEIDSLFKK